MESNGELWRHVGKGTFIGARPTKEYSDVAAIAALTNPREVMQARLLIEPQIAREAALNATAGDIAELKQSMFASRHAQTWRQYENSDNRLHRTVAEAAHNTEIGRANVRTPVTNAHLVCRLLLEKKNTII